MRRKNHRFAFYGLLLAGSMAVTTPVYGQIIYGRPAYADMQAQYSHWSLQDKEDGTTTTINQFTVPLTGFIPLEDNFEALVFIATSSNTLSSEGDDYNLSGLGDVRFQVNRSFNDDQFLVSLGINLPTGKKKLTQDEEQPVLQMLSQNYLSFPMRRFGEGFGFNLLVGGARMLGSLRGGFGVKYQYTGKYQPYEGSGDYDPGDLVSVNAGLDWQGEKTVISGDAVFTAYFKDKLDGVEIFKQSNQLDLRMNARYTTESYSLQGQVGYLLRGRNVLYTEELKIYGNEFWINAGMTRRFQQDWRVTPSVELRLIGANDEGFGGSSILGFGGVVGKTFGGQIALIFGGTYYIGSVDDGAYDLTGLQLRAGLTANL
jgi:hypothetical protein